MINPYNNPTKKGNEVNLAEFGVCKPRSFSQGSQVTLRNWLL